MSNILVTTSIIAEEALAVLENTGAFARSANRDWEDEFMGNMNRGYAPGQTINIRRPPRYTYRAGRVAVPQATIETTIPLTLQQGGTDLVFTAAEKTLSVSRFEDKIYAAMATVVNEIDRQGLQLAHFNVANTNNPAGAVPNTQALALAAITDLNQILDEEAAPRDRSRMICSNPKLNGALIQGFAGLFNSQAKISKQYETGLMVDSLGIAYSMDQNVDTHTNGAATATNINGANQTGSSITVVAVAGGTLTRGTTITLPGVFAVNPQSRVSTATLRDFVVTADVAAGATSIPIFPAITPSGAFQNVSASPTTGSPYVINGAASTSYAANIAFHKDAFTLAMVPMWAPPSSPAFEVAQKSANGFTVKVTRFPDGINDNWITRIDVLFGWAATYPELACKFYTV